MSEADDSLVPILRDDGEFYCPRCESVCNVIQADTDYRRVYWDATPTFDGSRWVVPAVESKSLESEPGPAQIVCTGYSQVTGFCPYAAEVDVDWR